MQRIRLHQLSGRGADGVQYGKCHADAYTRLLQRLPPDSAALWAEVQGCIQLSSGMVVIDGTTPDKPCASQMAMVTRHLAGRHHAVAQGINLISLVWTDGNGCLPCDFRLYYKVQDGLDKNDHFHAMVLLAKELGFQPALVAFDGWYGSLDNLKLRGLAWQWLTRLKSDCRVSQKAGLPQAIADLGIPSSDLVVHESLCTIRRTCYTCQK